MNVSRTLQNRSPVLDVDEANRLLPLVRTLASRIRRRVALIQRLCNEMLVLQVLCETSDYERNLDLQEFVDKKLRFHRLRGQVDALVERLAGMGCVVRDRDAKHVDFTFLRDDGLAVLCWQQGEDVVDDWHYMHEPHGERRPLQNTDS
ncbi:MAG: DUF2203 family protein [Candidatus Krumholzibacteriia bacterium]